MFYSYINMNEYEWFKSIFGVRVIYNLIFCGAVHILKFEKFDMYGRRAVYLLP